MALIVVGGQTKNIGKTTLICNIIVALPQVKWTAVKITNHVHAPRHCEIFKESGGWTIWNQNPTKEESDTAKFLRSGADGALLVQGDAAALEEACAVLEAVLAAGAPGRDGPPSAVEYARSDV